MNEQKETEKIIEMIEYSPVLDLDTEELDQRLLKGKYDVGKLLSERRREQIRKECQQQQINTNLISFLQGLKGTLRASSWYPYDEIKDILVSINKSIDFRQFCNEESKNEIQQLAKLMEENDEIAE